MAWSRRFSAEVKRAAFARAKDAAGVARCECHRCPSMPATCGGVPLVSGRIVYEHIDPWEFSRDSSLENCGALRTECARLKTDIVDTQAIAKSNRVRNRHFATGTPPRHPLPCGRLSRWKKPVGAFRPVPRVSQIARSRAYSATLPQRGQPALVLVASDQPAFDSARHAALEREHGLF